MNRSLLSSLAVLLAVPFLTQCGSISQEEEMQAIRAVNNEIAQEPAGDFYYGRRYYVPHTRFWGYLREPRQRWSTAKLVIIDEHSCKSPDRLPETQSNKKAYRENHGYDANFAYKFYGKYTGQMAYEPNTDQILPVFRLTRYELLDEKPGWLFSPREKYSTEALTIRPNDIPYGAR